MYVRITLKYHRWHGTQMACVLRERNAELKEDVVTSAHNLIHIGSGYADREYIRPHMLNFYRKYRCHCQGRKQISLAINGMHSNFF